MPNQELEKYIQQARQAGKTDEEKGLTQKERNIAILAIVLFFIIIFVRIDQGSIRIASPNSILSINLGIKNYYPSKSLLVYSKCIGLKTQLKDGGDESLYYRCVGLTFLIYTNYIE